MRQILRALLLLVLVFVGVVYLAYRKDIRAARERVLAGSRVIKNQCGQIEYATLGEGSPVLVLHGTSGGWDQGIASARELVEHGFQIIAPSRFGYLRTPLAADPSPSAEADTWACFLDSLNIRRLPIIAYSAGAAPTLQLALRHPDRVSAIVLIVPGAGGITGGPAEAPPRLLLEALYRFDFPTWGVMRAAPKVMYYIVAVPASLVPTLPPEETAKLDEMISIILPVSQRRLGVLNEGKTQGAGIQYPLEQVRTPTLLISAEDDLYRTLPVARRAARIIPNANLIEFPTGGHVLLGRGREIWPAVAAFIRQ